MPFGCHRWLKTNFLISDLTHFEYGRTRWRHAGTIRIKQKSVCTNDYAPFCGYYTNDSKLNQRTMFHSSLSIGPSGRLRAPERERAMHCERFPFLVWGLSGPFFWGPFYLAYSSFSFCPKYLNNMDFLSRMLAYNSRGLVGRIPFGWIKNERK